VDGDNRNLSVADIASCFEGIIPAEIATASADGVPNVTHLSRVHMVDDDHVALSNQFFSKTMQNLAENPRACVCLVDPNTYDSFKLMLQYERTERRGPLFERLRRDIDAIAALTGMSGVFKLRSADVYRVLSIDLVPAAVHENPPDP
jgi:predicted pyridoxine 5'-phosphate oxidase superfamily flavin-nucleotide-binding protein